MTAELICSASDPAWLDRRREGITATDITTIAGLVTYDSPWALYHRKLGLLPEVEQSDRMRLGSWLEQAIADEWWYAGPGIGFSDSYSKGPGGLFRSSARVWQMATPDRVIYDAAGLYAVLECKTSASRDGWGPDGSDVVPGHVRAQVLWQMDTLGVATGHVAVVFLPSGEFRSYTIELHHQMRPTCEVGCAGCLAYRDVDGLRDLGFGFWSRILRREPPPLDGLEVTTDALRALHPAPGGTVELDPAYLWRDYDQAAEQEARGKKALAEMKNLVRGAMGDAHEATVNGRVVFRRTIGKRAGYTVAPSETDTLRRIGKDKHDD